MNVNRKGVKGLIKVIEDLSDRNFYVFPAFDDHSPVDLVALSASGKCYRLQIKYRTASKTILGENRYSLSTDSIVNGKRVAINKNLIDGWALYLEQDKKVVYINKTMFMTKSITIDPSKKYGELEEWFISPTC